MTKKELLENPHFKALPDDAQLVFATNASLKKCKKITKDDLLYTRQVECFSRNHKEGIDEPVFGTYLVFNVSGIYGDMSGF